MEELIQAIIDLKSSLKAAEESVFVASEARKKVFKTCSNKNLEENLLDLEERLGLVYHAFDEFNIDSLEEDIESFKTLAGEN